MSNTIEDRLAWLEKHIGQMREANQMLCGTLNQQTARIATLEARLGPAPTKGANADRSEPV